MSRYEIEPETKRFQSTLLMRGATRTEEAVNADPAHFNPRSSCEERQRGGRYVSDTRHFNPRSSCEERRKVIEGKDIYPQFQSTLLMRGATVYQDSEDTVREVFQSTLLMRGATRIRMVSSG